MSIRNLSQIIRQILTYEIDSYKDFGFDVTHRPDIGDQYEDALKKSLKYAIPENIDIRLVSGNVYNSIRNNSGKIRLSGQIDCMLVYGDGHLIPGTERYAYPVNRVLAIIEVKKNFHTTELTDSYEHLNDIREIYNDLSSLKVKDWEYFKRIYAQLTGKVLQHYDDHRSLPPQDEAIFHGWLTQFNSPLRIVFGYEGFKSESSLRKKFYKYLSTKIKVKGFGPFSVPDLIVCGESCIVRFNGEPYSPLLKNGKLEFLGTNTGHTIEILCEILLSRISRIIPVDFTEDQDCEPLNYFMNTKLVSEGPIHGWAYLMHELDESELNQLNALQPWNPLEVSESAFECFKVLLKGNIPMSFFNTDQELLLALLDTRLTAIMGEELILITRKIKMAQFEGGHRYVGENADGYFDLWEAKMAKDRDMTRHNSDGNL